MSDFCDGLTLPEGNLSDFCKQCSLELLGEDTRDLAGLFTKDAADELIRTGVVQSPYEVFVGALCEGCGPTHVNIDGECAYHEAAGGTAQACYERYVESGVEWPAAVCRYDDLTPPEEKQ